MKTISFNLNFAEIKAFLTSIINIDKLMGVHDCSDQDYPRTPQEVKIAVAIELKAMGVLAYDLDNITDKTRDTLENRGYTGEWQDEHEAFWLKGQYVWVRVRMLYKTDGTPVIALEAKANNQ